MWKAGSLGFTALLGTESGVLITRILLQSRHRDDWGQRLISKVVVGHVARSPATRVLTWFIEDWSRELENACIGAIAHGGFLTEDPPMNVEDGQELGDGSMKVKVEAHAG